MACAMVAFCPIPHVPSLRARAHLSPTAMFAACVHLCLFCGHRFDVSPNWWTQAMVTGADAMVNGVFTGVILKQCSLAHWWMMAWIPGSLDHWWMLLTVPCWCCACAKNCDIPSFPPELISRPVFHHDCLCRFPFPTFSWHLKLRTVLISLRVFKSFRLCVPLDFCFMLQHTSVILKWWHSFYFYCFLWHFQPFILILL